MISVSGISGPSCIVATNDADANPQSGVSLRNWLSYCGTLVATFSVFGCFAVQGVVLARMLGPEGRGAFAATITYSQMLLYLGFLGAADLFAWRAATLTGANASESASPQDAPLRRSALLFGLLTGTVTMLVCMACIGLAMPADKQLLIPLALLIATTLPFQHVRLAVQAVDHGLGAFNRYNASRLVGTAAAPVALGVAWLLGVRTVGTAVVVYCIAMFAAAGLVQWGMRESWWGPVDPKPHTALRQGHGFAGSQVASELLDRSDLGLVLWLGTLVQQGFYASAVPIAGTMAIVPMVVATYTFRRGAVGDVPLAASQATKKLLGLVAAQICSGFALAALLPFVVPLLLGQAFVPAIEFAWYLIPAAAIRGIALAIDGYLRGRQRSRPGILGRLVALGVLLAVTAGLYPSIGVFAVPIGLAMAQTVCAVIVTIAMYQEASRFRADPLPIAREHAGV